MSEKIILTDCDGVILDFESAVKGYLSMHHYPSTVVDEKLYDMGNRYGLYDSGMTREQVQEIFKSFSTDDFEMTSMQTYLDAGEYLPKLNKELGYSFWGITAIGTSFDTRTGRCINLRQIFGDLFVKDPNNMSISSIENGRVTFLEPSFGSKPANKKKVLEEFAAKYPGAVWVEDAINNADFGHELGFRTFLIKHDYNESYNGPCTVVNNWKEIYDTLKGE